MAKTVMYLIFCVCFTLSNLTYAGEGVNDNAALEGID